MWITVTNKEYKENIETDTGISSFGEVTGTTKKFETEEIVNKTVRIYDTTRNKAMIDTYHKMQIGETYDFKNVKDAAGKWSLVSITKVEPKGGAGASSAPTTKKGMDTVGAQVGNALNVAANLLASGKTAQDLINMAAVVLIKSEELRTALVDGKLNTLLQQTKQQTAQKASLNDDSTNQHRDVEFDDDLPF